MSNDNKTLGKVAFKAGIWYVISSIIVKSIAVLTTPIFTRLMTTEEFGVTSTFTSWYSLLITFFSLNLTYSIGRAKIDFQNSLEKYTGSMMMLSALVSTILTIIGIVFIVPLSNFLELSDIAVLILIIYLVVSPSILFYKNEMRYQYKYKQNIAIAWYIAVSTVALSLVLMFCMDFSDLSIPRMIGITAPSVLLALLLWIRAIKNKSLSINKEYWSYGLRLSLPLIIHTISLSILGQSDRILIAKFTNTSDVGIYSLVYNYGILLTVITGAVSDGWLPYFHDNFAKGNFIDIKNNSKKLVILGCYIGLACIALAPEMVYLLGGEAYMTGLMCVPPVVLGIICSYIYTHYVNIEMTLKKTKYVSMGTIFAAILNVVLNIIFIPKFGYIAAAYTTMASYFTLMIIHYFVTRKILKVNLYNNIFMFVSLLTTCVVAVIVVQTYDYTMIRYALIFVGFVSFLWNFRDFIIKKTRK